MKQAILFSAIVFPLATLQAATWSLDLEGGAASASTADVRIPNDSRGTAFSMLDDVGGESAQAFGRVRLTWDSGERHVVSILAAPLAFEFNGTLDRDIRFDGGEFASGTNVEGKYRFDSYRLTYRYNFIQQENLTFGLGLTAKIRSAEISLNGGGQARADENTGFVPLAHLWLDWQFNPQWHLLVNADAAASSQGRAEDVAVALQYDFTKQFSGRIGYRLLEGGADGDDVETWALFHYATVGLTYRF
jgi:hypothetical protein